MDICTRLGAFICQICPLCIARRRWPQSKFARQMARLEKNCPACRAYRRVQNRTEEPRNLSKELNSKGG